VGRFLSAIAFAATLVVVLGAAGCGQRFDGGAADAPAPGDLAADALTALEAKGSAHFVADMKTGGLMGASDSFPFSLHLEGDASSNALDVQGTVGLGGASFTGRVLADEHNLFIQFMDKWYGEDQGLADALGDAKKEHNGATPWNDWATPDGLRQNFGELFSGDVSAGPAVDGVETWRFEGHLNADGLTRLGQRYGEPTPPDVANKLSEASRFVLVVGRDDHLPRRVEFSVKLTAADLKELSNQTGADNFQVSLALSDFGKPVEIHPPAGFKPLDALFEQFFSGFE
jgi:hypothetical protein